jgi:hypothetical protein
MAARLMSASEGAAHRADAIGGKEPAAQTPSIRRTDPSLPFDDLLL